MTAPRVELVFTQEWLQPRPMAVPRPLAVPEPLKQPFTSERARAMSDQYTLAIYLHVLGCTPHQIIVALEDPTSYGFQLNIALQPTVIS